MSGHMTNGLVLKFQLQCLLPRDPNNVVIYTLDNCKFSMHVHATTFNRYMSFSTLCVDDIVDIYFKYNVSPTVFHDVFHGCVVHKSNHLNKYIHHIEMLPK